METTNGTPVAIRSGRPLSSAQRSLWMSQRNAPGVPMQNMALLSHIDGVVDGDRLEAAFAEVVRRSDVLRSRFREDRGTPTVQLSSAPVPSERVRLTRAETPEWAAERARRQLDLAQAAYDSVIIEHEDHTTSWFLDLHHTITDARATALVFDYTARVYDGQPVDVPSYYAWAEERAVPDERALRYWRGRAPATGLGGLYQPHDQATAAAERAVLDLDPALWALVDEALGERYRLLNPDLSWTALLTTVLAVHIHRVSGAASFSVGVPVHNRRTVQERAMLGPLMEVFPVDVEVVDGETFAELHGRVTRSLMTTLRHALPGTAPIPDFQAIVNVIPGATIETFGSHRVTTTWLHSGAIDSGNLVRLQHTGYADGLVVDANVGAASPAHRQRLPHHLVSILRAAVTDPDQAIDAEPICTVEEERVLEAWEVGPATSDPVDVSTLLRNGLETDEVVLVDGDRVWSGVELRDWIDDAARWLTASGVGPGRRVGVCMGRSAEAVVAIAAVLAAGGSYVPLDPAHPVERRKRLTARADVTLVLDELPTMAPTAELPPGTRSMPSGSDEAYVLFTSGSTGEPKGVPITRDGLSRYLEVAVDRYRPGDAPVRAALFGSLTFDLTVTSLFLPLITGGQLVVIAEDGPAGLAEVARHGGLTWCKATPSHLEILDRLLPPDHSIHTFVVGGEAFRADLAGRLQGSDPGRRIFNEYGPTEAVVGCMIHRYDPTDGSTDVPIGGPMPGVRLRVVDSRLHRVPIGAPGELCVSSPGLTAGYLDSIADDPFVMIDGERFYRTGDLVRLLDEDTAVYLGRIDHQVKVGGIRLEPTEVEAAIVEHPSIKAAAVRLWQPDQRRPSAHCRRCGLPDNVPDVDFDDDGVCSACRTFDLVAPVAASWFGDEADLRRIRDTSRARRSGDFDCLHLLSGGKDSTYALYRLVELGFEPYVLTLDNGFISDQAKANVERTIAHLGVTHEMATTPFMNEIFKDSLDRHANVCHGCYKTIYTLATSRAVELGIPTIVTGLSRGQLFETRLIPQQFSLDRFDAEAIDRAIVQARRAYHRIDDAPRRLLDTTVFDTGDVFSEVEFVDIYRYLDVPLDEMLSFLDREAPWVRPSDTGRSTNCRVNDVGIHTHLLEEGFHNYAIPYAWDVRLGHKTRNEAMEELDDRLDLDDVDQMLSEIGYAPRVRSVLTAWFELEAGAEPATPAVLRSHLAALLPAHAVPAAFVSVPELPLGESGKLDEGAFPRPHMVNRRGPSLYVEAQNPIESTIVEAWERILGVEPVGIDDDFFALGGDSLAALEMVITLGDVFSRRVPEELAFTNTTPRELAEAIEALHPDGTHREGPPPPGDPAMPPSLSESELALLFENRRTVGSARFNVAHLHRVGGAIEADRFRSAVLDVAARHQPLTWTFGSDRVRLDAVDAVAFDADEAPIDSVEFDILAEQHHRRPFDLDAGPLLRVLIRRITDGTTAVLLVVHHVSADAAGLLELWRQIGERYVDERGSIEPLRTDLARFTSWQASAITEADRAFWLDQPEPDARLSVATPDIGGPDGFVRRVAAVRPEQLRALRGVSGAAVALASLGLALGRRCDGDRLDVGVVTSTRNHPAAAELVGYLLNTVPVVLSLPGAGRSGSSFADWCEQITADLAPTLSHRTYPISRIVRDRREAGRVSTTPEVLFAFDELPDTTLGGLPARHEVLFNGVAVAPLTVFVEVRDDRVDLSAEYQGVRFTRSDVECLLDDLDRVLSTGAARPTTSLEALASPLSASTLVGETLDPDLDPLAMIDHHLLTAGSAVAVACGDEQLTWADLDRRSVALAGRLVEAGIESNDRVLVSLPRTADLIVAIVATMRAGAAYVPLDPAYPEERQRLIAGQAGAKVAIVGTLTPHDLTPNDLRLDEFPATADPPVERNDLPPLSGAPDLEAYVMFTSGSTGQPRGVAVTRGGLRASTAARFVEYDLPIERFLLISSLSFDSSVAGVFWTLACGGTLVLPPDSVVNDVDGLLDTLEREKVTHTLMVPTLYRAMLERGRDRATWPLVVIVAGERCSPALVRRHFVLRPDRALYNEYGPTEATVWSTVHRCESGDGSVPIGHPIAGSRIDVVDERGAVVAPGVVGELLVSGPGVVTGYDDGSQADRFARMSTGERVFRTGDRAVIRDEVAFFSGRVDDQLNVGGVRLEPEEVEQAIAAVPGVAAAIVTVADLRTTDELIAAATPAELQRAFATLARAEDPAAELRRALTDGLDPEPVLVAHIEIDAIGPDVEELRRMTRELLPPNRRPRRFFVHDELPRSVNGKLDRTALTGVISGRPLGQATPSAVVAEGERHPGDDGGLTQAVAQLFADVLRIDSAGPGDSFFDVGGHSVIALRLLDELEHRLGLSLSVAELYRDPTPAGIARLAAPSSADRPKGTEHLLEIRSEGSNPPLVGVHVLGRNGAFYRPLAEFLGEDQPVLGLGLAGAMPDETTPRRLHELSVAYADELERAVPTGPVALAAVSVGAYAAIELAHRLEERGRTVLLVALFDAAGPDAVLTTVSFAQRLRLHGKAFRADPVQYLGARMQRRWWVFQRAVQRMEMSVREQLSAPLPDRLKVRSLVEQNVADAQNHRPAPLVAPILAFKATEDAVTDGLAANGMGWNGFSYSWIEVIPVSGGHLSMLDQDHAEELAGHLAAALERTRRAAEATDTEALERDLRLGLATHRLPATVDRWRARDLGAEALSLLDGVEHTARTISHEAQLEAVRIESAAESIELEVTVVPPPQLPAFSLIRMVADGDVDGSRALLSSLGYRPIGRGTSMWVDTTGAHRVELLAVGDDVETVSSGPWPQSDATDLGLFISTPSAMIAPVLDLAAPTADDFLVDLGCGDGRILVEAARRYGCRGRGVEIDPQLAAAARSAVEHAGLESSVEIVEGDATDPALLAGATVVFAFLPTDVTTDLLPRVLTRIGPGGRFVTHEQSMVDWPIEPVASRLVVADGITVAWRWEAPGSGPAGRPLGDQP